jgi:hypothetical protein
MRYQDSSRRRVSCVNPARAVPISPSECGPALVLRAISSVCQSGMHTIRTLSARNYIHPAPVSGRSNRCPADSWSPGISPSHRSRGCWSARSSRAHSGATRPGRSSAPSRSQGQVAELVNHQHRGTGVGAQGGGTHLIDREADGHHARVAEDGHEGMQLGRSPAATSLNSIQLSSDSIGASCQVVQRQQLEA